MAIIIVKVPTIRYNTCSTQLLLLTCPCLLFFQFLPHFSNSVDTTGQHLVEFLHLTAQLRPLTGNVVLQLFLFSLKIKVQFGPHVVWHHFMVHYAYPPFCVALKMQHNLIIITCFFQGCPQRGVSLYNIIQYVPLVQGLCHWRLEVGE